MDNFERLIKSCDENLIFYSQKLSQVRTTLKLYDEVINLLETESNELINLKRSIVFAGHLTIPFLELSVTLKNLIIAKTDWEKIFFIKNSYLIIFESLKIIRPEKNCSTILEESINSNNLKDLKTDLEKCNGEITNFRNTDDFKLIENVRHYTAGHIDKNLKLYYDTIINLDGEKSAQIVGKFMQILSNVLTLSQKTESRLLKIYESKAEKSTKELKEKLEQLEKLIKNVG
ncbi:hypothetical protein SAMN05421789_1227 [Kaistella chaponensis]|uniref:Uncharacterized protein n=1 Tax=Kaistella chaponensis TaxID=713588 RepID=A0A1N7P167_9FLAO|nr:hypothetical protein [Kaistella chaponensis]SIT04307.1 hypothetical protein SAMN05421789_1227 [Kaistella chaponensis]